MNREEFLGSISTRLGRARSSAPPTRDVIGVSEEYRAHPLGKSHVDLVERFQEELEKVGGTVVRCSSAKDLEDRLLQPIANSKAQSLVSWSRSEFEDFELDRLWKSGQCTSWQGGDAHERAHFRERAAKADIGLTAADLAIANTGSLVLRSGPTRPRCTSLLPTMHVALLRSSQIVARMGEALEKLATRDSLPSQLLFVTGPSRTSDIENDLTIGVHGPAAVAVFIVDDTDRSKGARP
jgi:L-lactate dehydrogenase complex protein LldG